MNIHILCHKYYKEAHITLAQVGYQLSFDAKLTKKTMHIAEHFGFSELWIRVCEPGSYLVLFLFIFILILFF